MLVFDVVTASENTKESVSDSEMVFVAVTASENTKESESD